MDDLALRELLVGSKTIAVVGMSDKPERDSNQVGAFLMEMGYEVIPINPAVSEILGRKSYPSLKALPPGTKVDIIDVFRKSDAVPAIVDEVLSISPQPKAVWLQLGVISDESGQRVRSKGIGFVQDLCIMVQHKRLIRH